MLLLHCHFVFQELDALVKQVIGKSTSLMTDVLKDQKSLEEFVEKCKRGGIFTHLAEPVEGPVDLERGTGSVLESWALSPFWLLNLTF